MMSSITGFSSTSAVFQKGPEKDFKEDSLSSIWKKASIDKLPMDDHHRGLDKLDETKFSVVEDEVDSLGHSSDSESDMEEIATKVKFYVPDEPAFTFKHTERLSLTDSKIDDNTPFLCIEMEIPTNTDDLHFFSFMSAYEECSQVRNVPVKLVKEALETKQKNLTINVNGHSVTIYFTADQGLTEEQILHKIREVEANQGLIQRKIKPDSIEFFKENTILAI